MPVERIIHERGPIVVNRTGDPTHKMAALGLPSEMERGPSPSLKSFSVYRIAKVLYIRATNEKDQERRGRAQYRDRITFARRSSENSR